MKITLFDASSGISHIHIYLRAYRLCVPQIEREGVTVNLLIFGKERFDSLSIHIQPKCAALLHGNSAPESFKIYLFLGSPKTTRQPYLALIILHIVFECGL